MGFTANSVITIASVVKFVATKGASDAYLKSLAGLTVAKLATCKCSVAGEQKVGPWAGLQLDSSRNCHTVAGARLGSDGCATVMTDLDC